MAQAGFKSGKDGATPGDLLERLGPTLLVDIGLKSRSIAGDRPDLPTKGVRALIDTGAGGDCIDDDLARSIGLPITDEGEISGIGGKQRAFIYTAPIVRSDIEPASVPTLHRGEAARRRAWHRVILGRTFLRPFSMRYDGPTGAVTIEEYESPAGDELE